MKKNTIILLSVTAILLLIVFFSFLINSKNTKEVASVKLKMPAKVYIAPSPVEKYTSDTGAIYISPTEDQYIEEKLIANLRNKCPINNEVFSIDFDYKINKFVVIIKDGSSSNKELFNQWMKAAGYDAISPQYFQTQP